MLEALSLWINETFSADTAKWFDYFTNGKHLAWYASVRFTLIAAFAGAAIAVCFGLVGAAARRSSFPPFRWLGLGYITMVRGIPDVLIILFFPLAIEQLIEWVIAQRQCSALELASDVWPPCEGAQWYLSTTEYLAMACLSLGIAYGAFAANVLYGALGAVPDEQLQAARAYGFTDRQVFWRFQVRQMWIYALPGLSNVWMLLLKATAFLSLLQIADIVLWAERLGAPNFFARAGLVHPDWRWRYYLVLFLFYILMTVLSEHFFKYLEKRASRGMRLNTEAVQS